MKNVLTLLVCALFFITGIAQSDLDNSTAYVPSNSLERTATLDFLYEQAKDLEMNGTAQEIEANRLAVKNEWQTIDPEIAALYEPVDNGGALPETEENVGINGVNYPSEIRERGEVIQDRDWDTDRLIRDLWVDGVDMDVTGSGDIYISSYVNYLSTGGTRDSISIYRSLNGGGSFEQWKRVAVTASVEKLQLVSFDGSGDEFIVAYLLTDTETFQAWRWNLATGDFEAQAISGSVSDFGVDRNYPGPTANQRAFAAYQKFTTCNEVHSARSTTGSYGFDWVDEATESSTCGSQIEFTYGRNGATYTTYTGAGSGNLYANVNNNFNDPASWDVRETVTTGAVREILNPKIAAARKPIGSDEVLIVASARDAGTSDNYDHFSQIRENGGGYSLLWIGISFPNKSVQHIDTWVRKVNDNEVIRTGSLQDDIDNTSNDRCWQRSYDGTSLTGPSLVNDSNNDVWDRFPPAVAETNDNLPCMAFAGTSGAFGYGLYFDAETVLQIEENNEIAGLSYYPNPIVDKLNVSAKRNIEFLTVYNILGQQTQSLKPNSDSISLDMSYYAPGMYIIELISNGEKGVYKIIKQ